MRMGINDLFEGRDFVKVCAPMVRYSKLPFRILAQRYGCDLCFTPMIMADSFVQSVKARSNEFTTCPEDHPLIVQFAANTVNDFVNAAEHVALFNGQFRAGSETWQRCVQEPVRSGLGPNVVCLFVTSRAGSTSDWLLHTALPSLTTSPESSIYPSILGSLLCKRRDTVRRVAHFALHKYYWNVLHRLSDGVDLNCGCPQRWAMKEGYGAHLLTKPETIRDMVHQVRNRIPKPYSVSVKIRLLDDNRQTVELARSLEAAGVTFLTLHARTTQERHTAIHEDALKDVCQSLQIPLVANGDVKSLEGAERLHSTTGCKGIMAARGMLANPAMFLGVPSTPVSCVQDWVNVALDLKTQFACFHHHLVFMLEHTLAKEDRRVFNALKTTSGVLNFLQEYYGITYTPGSSGCGGEGDVIVCDKSTEHEENSQGQYVTSKLDETSVNDDALDCLVSLYD